MTALAGILLVGMLTGCDKEEPEIEGREALYRIKGTVVDGNGTPVAGIGKGCWNLYDDEDQYVFYSDTTDYTGRFVMEHVEGSPMDTTIAIALGDMDGEANGLFADTVVVVHFLKDELIGGDGDVYGVAEKEITVVLRSAKTH